MSDRKPKVGDRVCWWDNKALLAGDVTKLSDTHATVKCGRVSFEVAFGKIDWKFADIKSRSSVVRKEDDEEEL